MRKRFDAQDALSRLRADRALRRPRRNRYSKLNRYRAELVALAKEGASFTEMAAWLKSQRLPVAVSTVHRYLKSLPEWNDGQVR